MKNDITKLTAYEIGILLDQKKIDPIILIEQFIQNYNLAEESTKNGITKILSKEAIIAAEKSWKRQKDNNRLSIFDGIPSGWKDVIDIKGHPAYGGSKLLKKIRKYKKVKDAYAVSNAKRSGIIPLFKTSTVEFAFGGLGINRSVKYPKNQMYKNSRCPGGSSSGSASSVFSNLIPIAIGTDTAGSVRIPSCWHALVGFKPTFNKICCEGTLPLSKSYDTIGTICKTVKDSVILYSILSNNKIKFFSLKENCKIGIVTDFNLSSLQNKDKLIFDMLINKLINYGFNLKKIKIPEFILANKIIEQEGGIVNYEAWHYWKESISQGENLVDKNVISRFYLGKNMSNKVFLELRYKINKIKQKIYNNLENIDFLIMPTLSINAPTIEQVADKERYIHYNNLILSNTRIANLFNLPAITIPIKRNYWLSFSIFCKEKKDEALLSIAQEIENVIYD